MKRSFLISIYTLTALSGGMMAFAEEIAFPSGLTLPLAILAFFFNEREQRFRIRTLWANVLGILAFAIAGGELLVAGYSETGFAAEGRLLAGSHLLSYLVWIALFQQKEGRQYWWLMALSVMQVAVGAILSHDPGFGGLLLVYVFLALWTLSVFSLYLAWFGFEMAGKTSTDGPLAAGFNASVGAPKPRRLHDRPDEFRGAIQLDPNERWINYRFVVGVLTTSLMSIGVGVVFFVLIPRLWVGKQYDFDDQSGAGFSKVTGFTDEVQLGEIGQILESNERVLEVRFFEADTQRELDVEETARKLGYDEPLFRGSVMGSYENGRWQVLKQSQDVTELFGPRHLHGLIRQHYIIHDGTSRTLFGMHPVFATQYIEGELIRPSIDVVTSILFRSDSDRTKSGDLEYVLFGAVPRLESDRPRVIEVRSAPARRAQAQALPDLLKLPSGLDRLKQLARQIADTVSPFETSSDSRDLRIARVIEQRLQSSGEYQYSLSAEIIDPSIDPVEDFLFNRKQGHCEYSATAMALMLRAVDIPSRLVSGFKGGQASGFSGAFTVEGRHAHAWVEALVEGRWTTFDPTPFARADSVAEIGADRSVVSSFRTLLAGFWDQRIVRLSIDEQRSRIYAPLGAIAKDVIGRLTSPLGRAGNRIQEYISDPRKWFSIETFVGTAVLMFLFVGVRMLWRKYGPQEVGVLRWISSQIRLLWLSLFASENVVRVEFYERFLTILARQGLRKRSTQTAMEFAADVETRLQADLSPAELDCLPEQLALKFYHVRYGEHRLTVAELRSIDASLERLAASLARR
ncbi:MAG: DUF3488 and transglutaminase-like domain-containing protein [Planctomycetota bacterium]|nr:DUF3488 and transglutaminase-like domain-containing protein [Planctomycetota bacterium]MDA1163461.1 DUF3488 and transglutaminase-like domain-containing protein [Planctomycetota bacterium]